MEVLSLVAVFVLTSMLWLTFRSKPQAPAFAFVLADNGLPDDEPEDLRKLIHAPMGSFLGSIGKFLGGVVKTVSGVAKVIPGVGSIIAGVGNTVGSLLQGGSVTTSQPGAQPGTVETTTVGRAVVPVAPAQSGWWGKLTQTKFLGIPVLVYGAAVVVVGLWLFFRRGRR